MVHKTSGTVIEFGSLLPAPHDGGGTRIDAHSALGWHSHDGMASVG